MSSNLLQRHPLNTAAAWLSGSRDSDPAVHVEIFFPSGHQEEDDGGESSVGWSCGIHFGGRVFFEKKRFSRREWEFHAISVTHAQYDAMYAFCHSCINDPFDNLGFFTNWIPLLNLTNAGFGDAWYCSSLVCEALNRGGVLDRRIKVHPDALRRTLLDEGITATSTARGIEMLNI